MQRNANRLALAAFLGIILIAGVNFVAVRFSNRELSPFWGAGLRFAIASVALFVVAKVKGITLPRGKSLYGAIIYGVLGFGASYAFAYWGLVRVQAGFASVIMALVPLMTFFLAISQGLELFQWRGLAGALLTIIGITLVFREQLNLAVPLTPILAMAASAFCVAETNIVIKRFPKSHPVTMNAIAMAVGSILLLTISVVSNEIQIIPTQSTTWISLTYLVFIGSITLFALYLFVLARWSASATSYQFVLSPLVTVPVASLLANEKVSPAFILGAILVLAGVYVAVLYNPKKESGKK